MNDVSFDTLTAELGGPGVLERRVAWFEPCFHAQRGVLLIRVEARLRGRRLWQNAQSPASINTR